MIVGGKYSFTIEELNCYTITIEADNEDEAWETFNGISWYNHPTRVDNHTDVDIQMYPLVHCQNCDDYGCHDCEKET